jgi:WD40 repeat protein
MSGEHLIITVHGIRTFGQWQGRLEKMTTTELAQDIDFVTYKFGYFSVLGFLFPFLRWLVVRRFRSELIKLCSSRPRVRVDLIGHSFGTPMIAWAIAGLPKETKVFVHTIILSGSVLRAGFPWRDLLGTRVGRVINDCGTKDAVLLLSQFCVLFTGMAGRTGFSGATSRVFRNRYSVFGHSGYFLDSSGKPSDSYMREYWLPLLATDEPVREFDFRKPSRFDDVVQIIANNAEPIKLAVYVAPFALISIWILGMYVDANNQRQLAEKNEKLAKVQRNEALISQSRFLADAANREANNGDAVTAALLALEALPNEGESGSDASRPYVPQAEAAALFSLHRMRERTVLDAHNGSVEHIAVTKDGSHFSSVSANGIAIVWNISENRLEKQISGTGYPLALDSEGRKLIAVDSDKRVWLWDPYSGTSSSLPMRDSVGEVTTAAFDRLGERFVTGAVLWSAAGPRQLAVLTTEDEVVRVAFTSDGGGVFTGQSDGKIILWDTTGKQLKSFSGHTSRITSLAPTRDGTRLLSSAGPMSGIYAASRQEEQVARIWDIKTGKMLQLLSGHKDIVWDARYSPDERLVVTASEDGTARVWDVTTGREVLPRFEHGAGVKQAFFSGDGKFIYTVAKDHRVRIWNASTGILLDTLAVPKGDIRSVAVTPTRSHLISGTDDGLVRIWDVLGNPSNLSIVRDRRRLLTAALSNNGEQIITAADNGTVSLWSLMDAMSSPLTGHRGTVSSISFCGLTDFVVTGSTDKTAIIWNRRTGGIVRRTDVLASKVAKVDCSPKSDRLVIVTEDGTSLLLSVPEGQTLGRLGDDSVHDTEFSSDGSQVLTIGSSSVGLWNTDTGAKIGTFTKPAATNDDGKLYIITAAFDRTQVRILVVSDDQLTIRDLFGDTLVRLVGGQADLKSADLSSDGKFVVGTASDGRVWLWDAKTGQLIQTLHHPREIDYVSFDPSSQLIVTLSRDDMVRVWRAERGELISTLMVAGERIEGCDFTNDGKRILAWTRGGIAHLWSVYPDVRELSRALEAAVPRCLSEDQRRQFFLSNLNPRWCSKFNISHPQ